MTQSLKNRKTDCGNVLCCSVLTVRYYLYELLP
jgi:hypothetical protein